MTHRLRDIGGFMVKPFLDALPVTWWGRRSPKVKADLDPPGVGSYSTLTLEPPKNRQPRTAVAG